MRIIFFYVFESDKMMMMIRLESENLDLTVVSTSVAVANYFYSYPLFCSLESRSYLGLYTCNRKIEFVKTLKQNQVFLHQ